MCPHHHPEDKQRFVVSMVAYDSLLGTNALTDTLPGVPETPSVLQGMAANQLEVDCMIALAVRVKLGEAPTGSVGSGQRRDNREGRIVGLLARR
jgi:hypothetical protein